jgi:hypothetical protein
MATIHEITIQGYVDEVWSSWFAGLTMTHTEQGETILRGNLVDQAALHGVLIRVRDLGLTLISVERLTADDLPSDLS